MKLIQEQEQRQTQQQKLTQQQMMLVRMLEMPLTELEQNVQAELDDNPALETDAYGDDNHPADTDEWGDSTGGEGDDDNFETLTERQEREEALDHALERIGGDDDLPGMADSMAVRGTGGWTDGAEQEQMVFGEQTSFYDTLKEQMNELDLTEEQQSVMEYLIGSLDSDGLLRKDLDTICDELAIYHNIDVTEKEVEEVLERLQEFDPAGIGARSLQECLQLQIGRKRWTETRGHAATILEDYYDDFLNKRWERIRNQMNLTSEQTEAAQEEIKRLNPKPGSALGETEGRNIQQITPDFIVDTNDDGSVTFTINRGRIPDLHVSPSFTDLLATYHRRTDKEKLTRSEKEAVVYAKEKVDRAQNFIEAVRQRRHTLYVTMKAIIDIQRKYFQDGDESDLRPMILKDVADRTGLDKSTISRVSNMKYAQTRWGTFKLRHFFSDSYKTESGEELSTRKIKAALKEVISTEDKRKPMSDEALQKALAEKGFPIARRTISKYREQMGIPVARLRKES